MSDGAPLGETRCGDPRSAPPVVGQAAGSDENRRRQWLADSFARFERPLLAYACRMLGADFSAAQDVVQETFMRLCREDPAKLDDRLAAWLFTVCRSRVIDLKRQRSDLPSSEHAALVADAAPGPAAAVEADEQAGQLATLLEALSPRQQEVLRLRLQAQLSYREIAEVTGLSVSNVGFHLHAAVRSLRSSLLGAASPEP